MKPYPAYKDSGVEWIGYIPKHWKQIRLKYALELMKDKSANDDLTKVGLENIQSWTGHYIETGSNFSGGGVSFESGDILFGKLRPYLAKVLLANFQGSAVGDIFVYRASSQIKPQFAFYRLISREFIDVVDGSTFGAKMPRASADFIGNLPFPIPSGEEQTCIANYLDHKTAMLDDLIAQKQRLIQLLQEERTAVISTTVTQGLDSRAPRKPSGIPWLGDIPAHWECKRLKYLMTSITGGGTPNTNQPLYWNGNIPWVSPKDMKVHRLLDTLDHITSSAIQETSTTLVPPNSILVVVRSGILKHTFPVAINDVFVTLNQDMKALTPTSQLTSDFLYFLLKGLEKHILSFTTKLGATVDSIDMEVFQNFHLPTPPLSEQQSIIYYLEEKTSQIDDTIAQTQHQITLLQEYRTTLISNVVTGKICVLEDMPL